MFAPTASVLPPARPGGRTVVVLGPTNTGKTHLAVERMIGHASGMIGLPLRLLAREIYERVVARCGPAAVALLTGEEKILPARARYFVCTVEAMPREREVDFLAVDEIQLCADPERGHVFTNRLLHARGREETMFLGAETMRPLLRALLPEAAFVTRPRFSRLSYAGARKLQRLPRRSAIVGFSADSVYAIAELIRRQRGGAAVVLGALSPRTRNAQVALYQSGEVDFLVATDAIGMGLNMDVDHVAFSALHKFDGLHHRRLGAAEIAQIAGRAGRYLNDGSFGVTGEAREFDPEVIDQIENHRFDPVRVLQWRSSALDFATLPALIASLEATPRQSGLVRAREASDLRALRTLGRESAVEGRLGGPAALRLLWQVCQIPDFRKTMADEHTRLLRAIFLHLMDAEGVLPEDWVAEQVGRLDRSDGDLDTLAARIAHIRTWTFVSNRQSWLRDARHWQERTRAIEDRLSDALHERLTQRFVDRRTSVLLRRLHQREELLAALLPEGDVLVEGEYVGRLSGFRFLADPRADGIHGRTLRHAAARALRGEIGARAARLVEAPDAAIRLDAEGRLWWEDHAVATLAPGASGAPGMGTDWLAPDVGLLADDLLPAAAQARIRARLRDWLRGHIEEVLAPLARLRRAESLTGLARGIAFRLVEALGVLDRTPLAEDLRALAPQERAQLRRLGVRFGARHVFVPALLKPQATRLRLLLWQAVHGGEEISPPPGRVSFPVAAETSAELCRIAGFAVLGGRAVRIDMLERLLDLIRPLAAAGPFAATPEMMALLGCGPADLAAILAALGYRARRHVHEDGSEALLWQAKRTARRADGPKARQAARPSGQSRRAAKRHADSPFAELLRLKQAMEAPS